MIIYLTFADSGHENIEDVMTSYASFIACIPGFENTTPNVRHNARQTTFRCNLTKVFLVSPLAIVLPLYIQRNTALIFLRLKNFQMNRENPIFMVFVKIIVNLIFPIIFTKWSHSFPFYSTGPSAPSLLPIINECMCIEDEHAKQHRPS